MNEDREEQLGAINSDHLVRALAAAVDERLEALDIGQAAIWLAGYVVGKLAAGRKGLDIVVYDGPLFLDMFDTKSEIIEDIARTREAGG